MVLTRLLRDVGPGLDHKTLPDAERALFVVVLASLAAAGLPDTGNEAFNMLTDSGLGLSPEAQKLTINAFGIRLRKRGDFEAAETFYRTALEVAPTDARIIFNLARTLYEKATQRVAANSWNRPWPSIRTLPRAKAFLRWLKRRVHFAADEFPDITI